MVSRLAGVPLVGANLMAAWLLPALAFCALPGIVPRHGGVRGLLAALVSGFALATLALGMGEAARRIGGTEPVLGIPVAARFVIGAAFAVLALGAALVAPWRLALAAALGGGAAALLGAPALAPPWVLALAALALWSRAPVALVLIAAVALTDSPLGPATLAQSVLRGLSGYVLLAVPLFILAAALLVASDVGARILMAARALAPRRRTALGEANIWASLLFGGISASSIADAATSARLLVPAMVAEGYGAARASAISAAAAILPNVMPPSIALLLAAAASDISVGRLWLAGAIAAPVLAVALYGAVRLTPPQRPEPGEPAVPAHGARLGALRNLAPVGVAALAIVGALRFGIVTAVEAGLVAVALSAVYAKRASGWRALAAALASAARQSGRVAILIAAAAPVAFVVAASGFDAKSLLPVASGPLAALVVAALVALLIGTVLDAGAAILLLLPILVPALAAAGVTPVHGALTLCLALLIGGLTPPVGILILVVKEITGAQKVYLAVLPYLAALLLALSCVVLVPLAARFFV
ncbi:MAG: TRAP transporter large permease subunit [Acuticoccus sp.]